MTEVLIYIKRPHEEQRRFIESPAKRKVIRAGRRGGKTTGVSIYACLKLLEGRRILYATPTAEQIGRFWWEVTTAFREAIASGVYYKNETEHILRPAYSLSEARIKAKTAYDANGLRGDYADLLILDEYQLMNEDVWTKVGAPMLLDNDGDAVFIFTGMRAAQHARQLYKRAERAMKEALQQGRPPRWEVFNFSSDKNPYLSREALDEISQDMDNLSYRMEILAEDPDDDPRALWKRETLDRTRVRDVPSLARVVVGVDPPGSASSGVCGIVVAGVGYPREEETPHGYVLDDMSISGTPHEWASQAVAAYYKWEADRIVAERNFGGDMVESTIQGVDSRVPIKMVTASRGKVARAEPISNLYEKDRIHHVGEFPHLEDEMAVWYPTGKRGHASPNRLDACVWALTELMLDYCATELGTVALPFL